MRDTVEANRSDRNPGLLIGFSCRGSRYGRTVAAAKPGRRMHEERRRDFTVDGVQRGRREASQSGLVGGIALWGWRLPHAPGLDEETAPVFQERANVDGDGKASALSRPHYPCLIVYEGFNFAGSNSGVVIAS